MKKILLIFTLIFMLIFVASCGDSGNGGTVGDETPGIGEGTTPGGGDTPGEGEGTTPDGDDTPGEGEGTTPGGDETPDEGEGTTPGGDDTPGEGEGTTPDGGDETPGEGEGTTPDGDDTPGEGDDTLGGDVDYGSATVYEMGDTVYFVGSSDEAKYLSGFTAFLTDHGIGVISGGTDEGELEILIGETDREASAKALELLRGIEKQSYFKTRYLVYARGGKLAIVYDENEYTPICALEYIVDEICAKVISDGGYVALAEGVVFSGTVDLIEEQKKLDEISLEESWNKLKASTTPEIYEAFRLLYTMYDEELIAWYANLYDSNVGMYYSNTSGMQTDGFLPTPETTKQALSFLESSGMLKGLGSYGQNMPKLMGYKIVYYCKSIQDPNGYFYNPAVSKATMDLSAASGRGRDLSWCTQLLKAFGSDPVYDTPNGHKGDGITADEYWASLGLDIEPPVNLVKLKNENLYKTASLQASSSEKVSRVIAASTTKDYMSDYKVFIDYLYGIDVDNNPYSGCGAINSNYTEIANKSDILLKKEGRFKFSESDGERYRMYDGMTLKEITIAYFSSKINPDTGLCGKPSEKNPTGTEFLFTNGFFKIIPVFNSWKVAYPEPMKAAEALLKGIVSDEPTLGNICDVYNVWSGLNDLRANVKNYGAPETKQTVLDVIDSYLEEYAAEAITVSYEKMRAYKRSDGGFSSSTKSSLTKMFGVIPIGTGVDESNVDAIGKPTWGMVSPMFNLLGLSSIQMYTRHHLMQYYEILLEDDPMKTYFIPRVEVLTYDSMPDNSLLSVRSSSSDISVSDVGGNSALKILKNQTTGQTVLDLKLTRELEDEVDGFIFETDIRISDVEKKELIAFSFGPANAGHSNRAYRFALQYDAAYGSKIKLREEQWTGSGTSFTAINTISTEAKVGEWFNLRIVYDTSRLDTAGAPETRVYIDGKLVHTTNNVYSAILDSYDTRATLSVIMFTQLKCTLWLDNTSLKQYKDDSTNYGGKI